MSICTDWGYNPCHNKNRKQGRVSGFLITLLLRRLDSVSVEVPGVRSQKSVQTRLGLQCKPIYTSTVLRFLSASSVPWSESCTHRGHVSGNRCKIKRGTEKLGIFRRTTRSDVIGYYLLLELGDADAVLGAIRCIPGRHWLQSVGCYLFRGSILRAAHK